VIFDRTYQCLDTPRVVQVGSSKAAFRYSLSVLKIYSARNVYYRFSVLAVNIETQPMRVDATAIVTFRLVSSQFPRSASIFVISGREVVACSVPSAFSVIDVAISTRRPHDSTSGRGISSSRGEPRGQCLRRLDGPMLIPRLEGIAMAATPETVAYLMSVVRQAPSI